MTTATEIKLEDIKLTPRLRGWLAMHYKLDAESVFDDAKFSTEVLKRHALRAIEDGALTEESFQLLTSDEEKSMSTQTPTPDEVLGSSKSATVNVKSESSKYSSKRYESKHAKFGEVLNPATNRPAELPSELDHAKSGAFMKYLANKSGLNVHLPEHERALLDETCQHDEWCGAIGGEHSKRFTGTKTLLDDVTSGGAEIVPVFFDQNVISFPLLTGELLPNVNLVEVSRGRQIEGASINTPTVTWGTADGSEIALFDTSSLVAELNSTVQTVTVALEIGRDFLADSAVDVGGTLTRLIGERLSSELDRVIAVGNGTTEPTGLSNSSISTVSTDNSAAGPPTLADFTSLHFGVAKQYRQRGCYFISNDTSFQRSRSIRIDPQASTTDQRPVLSDVDSFNTYRSLGWPHLINNSIGNTTAFFGNLSRYRLYRRQGLELRFVDNGQYLARRNLVLLIARARFAGRVMDVSAFSSWTDGQS